jgi:pyridoxamine 5'-phosphate oxidase
MTAERDTATIACMSTTVRSIPVQCLPEILPPDPLVLAAQWLAEARADADQPNSNSMVLATVDARGRPSARVVLCKEISVDTGSIVFYTNYDSRKGRDLAVNPHAAVVFHWDHRHRQVRAEGAAQPLSDAENDAYFSSRPWQSRLGAWASRQSEPVASRDVLIKQLNDAYRRFGIPRGGPGDAEPERIDVPLPRPPHWGGYRIVVDVAELWVEGEYRIHDRARWTRLPPTSGAGAHAAWNATRLQP